MKNNHIRSKSSLKYALMALLIFSWQVYVLAQDDPDAPPVDKEALKVAGEEEYYPIITMAVPEDMLIEAGGVATLPDGRVMVATRRGQVWLVENPTSKDGRANYKLFASGLHEPLGCTYYKGAVYLAQRGELTKLIDSDGDDVADVYETVYAWPLSGHYHEYSFGPAIDDQGNMFVTANVAFGDEEWWRGESRVPMRGWTMKIKQDGTMEPWATGMRSPAGFGMFENELFYDDNQGDWIGSGAIWHVKKGVFTGHPAGLKWTESLVNSPVSIKTEELYASADPQIKKNQYDRYVKPENKDDANPQTFYDLKGKFPAAQVPAVWLPHGILGISNAEIKVNKTGGKFGPFENQLFVGDQGQSKVMRVFLEKVNGEYQGAAFDFRAGFQSGVLRMDFANDGSLMVGETNRGWGSAGEKNEGFERLIWSGKTPFEMKEVRAMPDGFDISFTKKVDATTLKAIESYVVNSWTYKYFPVYGSPPIKQKEHKVLGVKVGSDGKSVRLIMNDAVRYHVHEIILGGVKDVDGNNLLHPTAYYTLNNIPEGTKLASTEYSSLMAKPIVAPKNSTNKSVSKDAKTPTKKGNTVASAAPTYEQVLPLLKKYTCIACHNAQKKQIGPSYAAVAKRNYSNERMLQLIWKPEPSNWPEYATPMAPMPHVKREDGLKIAQWINSLR